MSDLIPADMLWPLALLEIRGKGSSKEYFRGLFLPPLCRKQRDARVSVCAREYASVTDVSQSASPHAEACPSLGSKPRQEASALTPGAPAAAGREEHPLAPHRGGIRAPTTPSKG